MMKKEFNRLFREKKQQHQCFAVLWFILFISLSTFAEHLPVKIYTSADGLGSSFVDYLIRDSRGFMWFCTRDGLSRFDGSRFVTYQIGAKNSPPGIESIYETRNGMYWITTTLGVYRFNPNDISQPDTSSPRLNAEFITPMRGQVFEDSKGNIWFSANGLLQIKEKDGKTVLEKYDLPLPSNVNSTIVFGDINETPDGSLWMNTNVGVIRMLPDERTVYYPFETALNSGNTYLMADKEGYIWLTRNNHLLVLKPEPLDFFSNAGKITIKSITPTSTFELKPEEKYIMPDQPGDAIQLTSQKNTPFVERSYSKKIFQTSDGNIWITADNYLLQFHDGVFHLHSDQEGLPTVMARMAEDVAGNLWIGSYTGLVRIDRNGLVTFGKADGANSSRFFAINESADGTLYFAAHNFYLNRFDGTKLEAIRPQIPAESNFLWASRYAFLDSDNNWWLLTGDKLYRFDGVSNFEELRNKPPTKIYSSLDGLKSNGIFQIFQSSNGDIWVSTRDDKEGEGTGTARLNKETDKFFSFSETDGLPLAKAFSSAVEDLSGNIWFSFYGGGLARFNGQKFEYFGEKEGVPGGVLPDLLLDKKGRLWIGSVISGLIRLDNPSAEKPSFNFLTTADGLSSNNIRTMTLDNFGRIYVGSARGVDRISPETGRIKHYSVSDGLAADFVVDSRCDKNGNLWFATNDGVSRLIPLPDEATFLPGIFLGGLRIAGVEQPLSELGNTEIEKGDLSPTENNFQIDFFGLDFRAGETLRYQYKLEGADQDWSAPSEFRTVTFANLQPARYRFLVRAVNSDGMTSRVPAVVSFKILPPIWARWWFITLCVLVAIGIFISLERYRAARLREIKTAFGNLSVSENRFRNLVEQSPFGIMVLSPDGKIRAINEAYLKMWGEGTTSEQILNWDIRNDEQMKRNGVVEGLGRAFAGEFVKFEPVLYNLQQNPMGIILTPDTQSVWIDAVAYPIKDEDGSLREVICVLENISARKIAEEKLERSRQERLIELEQVRSRIATDLHDDIGASLTQIAVLSEVAQAQGKISNGASTSPLSRISDVSNELVEAMSDIVWSINPAKDHLSDLTQRMRRFASDVLSAKGIVFQFQAVDANSETIINTNLRREVFLLFKESINNIVKHSGAKHATIDLRISDGNLKLKIVDDGKGFDLEKSYQNSLSSIEMGGNGIASMQKRAAELHGKLEIVSEDGKGTIVNLILPLEQIKKV